MTEAFACCGVRIDGYGPADAAAELLSRVGSPCAVHLCNAYTLSLAARDQEFGQLLDAGDLNFADGAPVARLGRRQGLAAMHTRVYGPTLMAEVLDQGRAAGIRHYLYGSSPEVIAALVERLPHRFPGLVIVGVESPPFRDLTDDERADLAERVRASGADIVWVGLGTPKQDRFVHDNRDLLGVPLVAVGAAFDFFAGTKRMAPGWIQRAGLEWLYRMLSEPRRLWRRYLIGNTVFLWTVARESRRNRRA